jgi:NAD(P)-dependent dehydrogenase (short-subunit alcohol dehydrogenase family)
VKEQQRDILVTGATRGLGLESALALGARGFRVWAGYRRDADAAVIEEAAAARGVAVRPLQFDVTDFGSTAAAVDRIAAAGGGLYGLVNNAAVTLRGYFEDLSDAEIRSTLEVNLFGMMNATRAVLPHLRAAGRGRIIMMSSVGGRIGSMGLTAYVASKFGVEGFSESLSLEMAPLGVQVIIVEPGIVNTAMWNEGRRVAAAARDRSSPYYEWFTRAEAQADALVRSSKLTPADVAAVVAHAMTVGRPRLRYTVGRRASLVMSLRRYLPGELFERLYFGEVIRRVTGHRPARRTAG